MSPFTPEEARELFDATALRYMGMSGADFLKLYDADEFREETPQRKRQVERVAALIPLVRNFPRRFSRIS